MSAFLRFLNVLLVLSSLTLFTACGSTKISSEHRPSKPLVTPTVIYVSDFDIDTTQIKSDPGTLTGLPRLIPSHKHREDPAVTLHHLSEVLAVTIVDDLKKSGIPSARLAIDATRPTSGWQVSGRIVAVDQGNKLQKAIVGLGIGNSQADIFVYITEGRDPADGSILSYDLKSTGSPGAPSFSPYGVLAKVVLNRDASEADLKRAGHQIAGQLVGLAQPSK